MENGEKGYQPGPLTMTVESAGAALGVSRGTAYMLVNTGVIPHLHLGRRIVVPVKALEKLLAGGRQEPDAYHRQEGVGKK